MNKSRKKLLKRIRRHKKIRTLIKGSGECPRLSVFRSNKGMFLQIIDDQKNHTIVSANSKEVKAKGAKKEISYELGKMIAEKALAKNITKVVFDRGGYQYHGRVEAAARGAREGGLKF